MAYCGQFGCGCCSNNCRKCGNMKWRHELDEEGICNECVLNEQVKTLENKVEKLINIRSRLVKKIKQERS